MWGQRGVAVRERGPGPVARADEGLGQAGRGDADARRGGPRRGARAGLAAWGAAVGVAGVRRPATALQGRAARAWGGRERGPWGENRAAAGRVCGVHPWPDMRHVVLAGPRAPRREAPVVAHAAAAMVDAWGEGAQRWALGCQRRELRARVAPAVALARSGGGIGLGMAGCDGGTVACEREGSAGKRPRPSYVRRAETRGPVCSARPRAMGCPWTRWRQGRPHASLGAGVWTRTLHARVSAPAAGRPTSWLASAQSRPTHAATASRGRRVLEHRLQGRHERAAGPCELTCGDGMSGSRWRGRA